MQGVIKESKFLKAYLTLLYGKHRITRCTSKCHECPQPFGILAYGVREELEDGFILWNNYRCMNTLDIPKQLYKRGRKNDTSGV